VHLHSVPVPQCIAPDDELHQSIDGLVHQRTSVCLSNCSRQADPTPPTPPVSNTVRPRSCCFTDRSIVPYSRWCTNELTRKLRSLCNRPCNALLSLIAPVASGLGICFSCYQSTLFCGRIQHPGRHCLIIRTNDLLSPPAYRSTKQISDAGRCTSSSRAKTLGTAHTLGSSPLSRRSFCSHAPFLNAEQGTRTF
jgi:hypothetical protein